MLMLLCPLLSALATPSFSLADLRSQITTIVVGFILLVIGIGAAALFFFRSESRDLTLIYFSLFSILYAIRLLLSMPVIRSLSGVSDSLRHPIEICIGDRPTILYGGHLQMGGYHVWVEHGFLLGMPGTEESVSITLGEACDWVAGSASAQLLALR